MPAYACSWKVSLTLTVTLVIWAPEWFPPKSIARMRHSWLAMKFASPMIEAIFSDLPSATYARPTPESSSDA